MNENYNLQPDTSFQTVRNADSYNLDTRKKLEADVYGIWKTRWSRMVVLGMLDRQAAITKNECREEHRKRLGELHGLLDEAARGREELAWRVEYNGELVEKVKRERNKLQHENDALKERISQFDVLKTAETAENATSKDEIHNFDDSREQLEADVASILRNAASRTSINTSIGDMLRYTVPGSGAAPWQTAEDACEALASIAERQIAELTAEVEKQRQRANDAERGVLSDEWYVARDRYEDDVAALTAERDALKAKLESYGKVPGQDECKKQQPMESGDTRERLEADLEKLRKQWKEYDGNFMRIYSYVAYAQIVELLDRQAAITIRECTAEDESCCEACRAAQKRKIAELTAERDTLQGALDIAVQNESKLEAERDELREALDACGTGTMYELWRKDHARLEALRAAQHDKPGT